MSCTNSELVVTIELLGLLEYNCIMGDSGKSVGVIVVLSYIILSLSSTLCFVCQ